MSYTNVDQKVVVVTGAAQGIGAAYAQRLHKAGATVVAVDRADHVRDLTGCTSTHVVDVADANSCSELADELNGRYGRVDGLPNNAAIFSTLQMKPFWQISVDEWDRLMAVNLKGPWLLTSTRTAGPDDLTGLAVFLLSDDSNYLTGQTISVNGGLLHR
jgi:NAD(P)-dependent dehydrogenase (short-subunit alcohol dehydrogenase family)